MRVPDERDVSVLLFPRTQRLVLASVEGPGTRETLAKEACVCF